MASVIQVVINAQDQTGAAFASAQRNVQGFALATTQAQTGVQRLGTTTAAASTQAGTGLARVEQAAEGAEAAIITLGIAGSTTATRMRSLGVVIQNQEQRLPILEQRLRELRAAHDADSVAVRRAQAAYDALNRTLANNRARMNDLRTSGTDVTGFTVRGAPAAGLGAGLGAAATRGISPGMMAGMGGTLGALGIAASGGELVSQMVRLAAAGQQTQVALDGTRASLGALMGDQARANDVFDRAIAVGQQYGSTQQQTADAIQASALLIRDSRAPIEDLMTTLMRLSTLNPAEGVQGAAFAVAELASGDITSLTERFRIGRDVSRAWRDEIAAGADPLAVVSRGLEDMNVTTRSLQALQSGAAGQQREYNQSIEELGMALNDVGQSLGVIGGMASLFGNTATEIRNIRAALTTLPGAFQNLIPEPVMQAIGVIDRLEDRLSGVLQGGAARVGGALGMETGPRGAVIGPPQSALIAPLMAPGATQTIINVPVTVQGSVASERDLSEAVRRRLIGVSRQNGINPVMP